MSSRIISKNSFVQGLTCHRKLWQLLWDRRSAAPPAGISRLNMAFGIRFGEIAHELYPDAVLIDINVRKLARAEDDTRRVIAQGAAVVLEATFRHEQCRVLADVIERQADGTWHLVEVKSSSRTKPEHIPDLAYQKWVMEQAGYPVSRCSIIFADKTGTWPDRTSIFKRKDVTAEVDLAVQAIPEKLAPMLELARSRGDPPEARQYFSRACHDCEFKETVCWKDIDEPTIYDVVNARKHGLLEAQDVFYARDVPADFALSPTDRRHVDCIQSRSVTVDEAAIRSMLDALEYPVHYLDFETIRVAVPLFDGTHPWEQLPFQYSVHVLDESGSLDHREYLHEAHSNPLAPLADRLVDDIGESGSIVVYSASMESGVLKDLARRFPAHASRLRGMDERLWDLEKVFRKHYRDWRFGSRSSIKVVLPVLVPELDHADEEISDGGEASLAWVRMIESNDFAAQRQIADELRSYCGLDTLAMVKLVEFLRRR